MNRNRNVDHARNLLGLSIKGTVEDAKKQYRELAKRWHPDIRKEKDAHIR